MNKILDWFYNEKLPFDGSPTPLISIIIPCYNDAQYIEQG
jgi:cellulose synthase/poly-beta-1,6-N-acetylglucosamine synthase-like glycosyltransferase